MDQTIGDEGDSQLGDFIEDSEAVIAVDAVSFTLPQDQLQSVLATLSEREASIVRLRFGLTDGQPRTLDQIGHVYGMGTPTRGLWRGRRILFDRVPESYFDRGGVNGALVDGHAHALDRAVHGNPQAINGFARVSAGVTSPAEFLSEGTIGRILAATGQPQAS